MLIDVARFTTHSELHWISVSGYLLQNHPRGSEQVEETEKEKKNGKPTPTSKEKPDNRDPTPQRVGNREDGPRAIKGCVRAKGETVEEIDRTRQAVRRKTNKERPG